MAVAAHHGLLRASPEPQRQHSIHKHQLGAMWQTLQGPQHGLFGRQTNATAVDFAH
jgi:hypothetical protein